jgi:hypothetical protein
LQAVKQELQPVATEEQLVEVWMKVGAIRAVESIVSSLESQTIRNLQQIRDQELFRALGFQRFKDFMESDRAPMNYQKFNRLEGAIEREGDALFDYLQAIDAPLSQRKLLGKGDVRVEGKEVVAQVGDEEIRVPLNNQSRILSVLSRVVDQRNEQARKIKRGEKEVKALKDKVAELKTSNGHGTGQGGFFDAQLNLIGSFSVLAAEAEKLPEDQRKKLRKSFYNTVAEHMKRIDEAFGLNVPDSVKKRVRVPDHLVDDEEEE